MDETQKDELAARLMADLRSRSDTAVERALLCPALQPYQRAVIGALTNADVITTRQPRFDLDAALRDWGKTLRAMRRTDLTVTVVQAYTGPVTWTQHPTDGRFIECGYDAALQIHALHPLRLMRVLETDRADFAPAWPGVPFEPLSPPPYETRVGSN